MTPPDRRAGPALPDPVAQTLAELESLLGARFRLIPGGSGADHVLWGPADAADPPLSRHVFTTRDGRSLTLEVLAVEAGRAEALGAALSEVLRRLVDLSREVEFFTYELSERYEEINLLYSISETLGSILHLEDAARLILSEVCDVLGAKRGSLWVHDAGEDRLILTASVGEEGLDGPLDVQDPEAITATVFREGRPIIASRRVMPAPQGGAPGDSFLSVPIRYSPPSGSSRTVGVVNLIGRRGEERFSAADQKLLAAIASQIGAALENNRLIKESLSRERMSREMELAHDLQMKLLPRADRFEGAEAAARVSPAEQVGGDFYQLFPLSGGRVGVMLGDVSLHGFPSALIMTLTMSAAGIYAREYASPARVLAEMDRALREELATTEMFLTVFYGVVDAAAGTLTYANAGHPHAFRVGREGAPQRLLATDPPMGFAAPDSYGEQAVEWERGDLLLLFTDGLSDVLSTGTRNDGERKVLDCVSSNREAPASEIVERLFALTADAHPPVQGDDRTALVVRV